MAQYVKRTEAVDAIQFLGKRDPAKWPAFCAWCVENDIAIAVRDERVPSDDPDEPDLEPRRVVRVYHQDIAEGQFVVKTHGLYARTELMSAEEFRATYLAVEDVS